MEGGREGGRRMQRGVGRGSEEWIYRKQGEGSVRVQGLRFCSYFAKFFLF